MKTRISNKNKSPARRALLTAGLLAGLAWLAWALHRRNA